MSDSALDALYENNIGFRLYAEYSYGLSVQELATMVSRPTSWVEERIEAMRLCIEQQIQFA